MQDIKEYINESLSYNDVQDLLLQKCEEYVKEKGYTKDDIFDHEDEFQTVVLKQMLDNKEINKSIYNKLLKDLDLWDDLLTSLTEGYGDY